MAKLDKILGSISPAYGLISGQGAFGKLRNISPALMAIDDTEKKKKKKRADGTTTTTEEAVEETGMMRKGGKVKKMASGGAASKRADGIAQKGKTRGKMC
jgi:hypothetical protein